MSRCTECNLPFLEDEERIEEYEGTVVRHELYVCKERLVAEFNRSTKTSTEGIAIMPRKRVCIHCGQPITYKQAFNALDFGREEHVRLKDCVDGLKALLMKVRDVLDGCETTGDIEKLRNLIEKA